MSNYNLDLPVRRLGLKHLCFLTDSFSIWQHTKGKNINRQFGYALDDAARALPVALLFNRPELARTYLDFIKIACFAYPKVINFFDENKQPIFNRPVSEDAIGEVYWALAVAKRTGFAEAEVAEIAPALEHSIRDFVFPRSQSYALLGALSLNLDLANRLSEKLAVSYRKEASLEWPWLEPALYYANAIIPYALIRAGSVQNRADWLRDGFNMLDFLNKETKIDGVPITIGNKGWYPRGGKKCLYDSQPIDIAYSILANLAAWEASGKSTYLHEAKLYLAWFWGYNLGKKPFLDISEESCRDGLSKKGISPNRGAENVVCYLYAQELLWPHLDPEPQSLKDLVATRPVAV